jgi:hypothetical protein
MLRSVYYSLILDCVLMGGGGVAVTTGYAQGHPWVYLVGGAFAVLGFSMFGDDLGRRDDEIAAAMQRHPAGRGR